MRKTILLSALCLLASFSSCELEMSDNGDLDGFWVMQTIDTLSTGTTADVHEQGISWSFQGQLMMVRKARFLEEAYFSFHHQGDSLHLFNPFFSDRENNDLPIHQVDSLRLFGFDHIQNDYVVLQLNGSTMRLQSKSLRLTFRKY